MSPTTTTLLSPQLSPRRTKLRPIAPKDHGPLYELAVSQEINWLWRFRGATPTFQQFVQSLHTGVLCQFVVTAADADDPLGLVIAYNADMRNRFCYAAACLAPNVNRTGMGIEAFILFVQYVFYCWEFRKIYLEATELNMAQYQSGAASGIYTVEGRMKDHMYMAGRYWDNYLLGLDREQFEESATMARLQKLFQA
jgi:RimJ/RimL family protein N-acetyltransferase